MTVPYGVYRLAFLSRSTREGLLTLEDIKPMHLVDLMDKLANGERPGTLHYIHRAIRSVLTRAVEWRLIHSNPTDGVKTPRLKTRELDVYTKDETAMMIFSYLEEEELKII